MITQKWNMKLENKIGTIIDSMKWYLCVIVEN